MTGKNSSTKQAKATAHVASAAERREHGKSLREGVPRKDHAAWEPAANRKDPMAVLAQSDIARLPELIPIRYGRMMKSPFTFFRGSAALMAADLAKTPVTGLRVQACGDCHLLNFGAFATPERNLIVDINDFDETLPAAWEWDLKRLGTSFVLACRANRFKEDICRSAAETVARSYREAMESFAEMRVLDVWYTKMDLESFITGIKDREFRKTAVAAIERRKGKSLIDYYVPRLTVEKDGRRLFKDTPPLVYHSEEQRTGKFFKIATETFQNYKETLGEERRVLVDRYRLQDVAMKIVGIGSVGTYCAVLLLLAGEDDPLILQVKEAHASVLEPYAGKSTHNNHGRRIVIGQRIMQAHSDIFLGWATGAGKYRRHFFLRQLRDMKLSMTPEIWTEDRALEVAEALGWVLARAHARSGDPAMIAGYLGSRPVFDEALADFSVAYADQSERDHAVLLKAIKSGRVEVYAER